MIHYLHELLCHILCALFVDILLTFYATFHLLFTDILLTFYRVHCSRVPFYGLNLQRKREHFPEILFKKISTFYEHFMYFTFTFCVVFLYTFYRHFMHFFLLTFYRDNTEILHLRVYRDFFSGSFYRESKEILQTFVVCRLKSL